MDRECSVLWKKVTRVYMHVSDGAKLVLPEQVMNGELKS